jgi:hypothetical protein
MPHAIFAPLTREVFVLSNRWCSPCRRVLVAHTNSQNRSRLGYVLCCTSRVVAMAWTCVAQARMHQSGDAAVGHLQIISNESFSGAVKNQWVSSRVAIQSNPILTVIATRCALTCPLARGEQSTPSMPLGNTCTQSDIRRRRVISTLSSAPTR